MASHRLSPGSRRPRAAPEPQFDQHCPNCGDKTIGRGGACKKCGSTVDRGSEVLTKNVNDSDIFKG